MTQYKECSDALEADTVVYSSIPAAGPEEFRCILLPWVTVTCRNVDMVCARTVLKTKTSTVRTLSFTLSSKC